MQYHTENNSSLGKAKPSPLTKFKRGIEVALANKRQSVESQFAEAYEEVEHAISLNMPQKAIINELNKAYGLKLHPSRFRQLLQGERIKRSQLSETLPGTASASSLAATGPIESAASASPQKLRSIMLGKNA